MGNRLTGRIIIVLLALLAGIAGSGCNEFMIRWSSDTTDKIETGRSREPRAEDSTLQPKANPAHFNENGSLKDLAVASLEDMQTLVGGSMCKKPFSKYIFLRNGEMTIYRLNKETGKGRLVEGRGNLELELPAAGARTTTTTVPYCGGDTAGGSLLPGIFTPTELPPEDLPEGVTVGATRAGSFIYNFSNELSDKSKVVIYMRLHERFLTAKAVGYFRTAPELRTLMEGFAPAALKDKKIYVLKVADSDEFAIVFSSFSEKDRRKHE